MTQFNILKTDDGRRIALNITDVVSVCEVTDTSGLNHGACFRLRNGDTIMVRDMRREVLDDFMSAVNGYPDRQEY